ncbi:hypothetical protein R1sor_019536 [Riccia sorocarpa]|uniref:Bifunctional inhibitor/plant lipid transfer protein/seed storage helical domain-containing protein n=1 Tax=Riccia sorocarpa TaxID=122646 RepID=A0ABD3IEJ0_9MARC
MANESRLTVAVGFLLVMVVMSVHGTKDGDPPVTTDSCADVLTSLLPCAPAVGKNAEKPTEECCSAIKDVSPTCVCYLVSTKPEIPDPLKDINFDAVAKLPKETQERRVLYFCAVLLVGATSTAGCMVELQHILVYGGRLSVGI